MSLNKIMLIGNVGKTPEVRAVGDTKVAQFNLATTERFKGKDGNMREETEWHSISVWEKNNCTPSQFYMKNCEYIFFCRKGKAKWITNIGTSKTVHRYNNVIGNKCHPTEKPISLMEFYIENSSKEGDTILDPFMGSGSTGVACVNTNRNFIGIELNEEYFKTAEKRINDAIVEKESKLF